MPRREGPLASLQATTTSGGSPVPDRRGKRLRKLSWCVFLYRKDAFTVKGEEKKLGEWVTKFPIENRNLD